MIQILGRKQQDAKKSWQTSHLIRLRFIQAVKRPLCLNVLVAIAMNSV
jgi:hypothetical protein